MVMVPGGVVENPPVFIPKTSTPPPMSSSRTTLRRVGAATKEKLKRVVEWVKKRNTQDLHGCQLQEENFREIGKQPQDMLFTFATLTNSCKALFYAPVAEIFLPFNSISHDQCDSFNKEDMFVGRRLYKAGDGGLPALWFPIGARQLYVWDEADYAPLLVRNKAAELLFGNIRAERVCSYCKGKKQAGQVDSKDVPTHTSLNAKEAWQPKAAEGGVLVSCSAHRDKKSSESKGKHC